MKIVWFFTWLNAGVCHLTPQHATYGYLWVILKGYGYTPGDV